jgi:RNA polymerase sigma-70 factor (ECF subfamily)
VSDQTRTSYWGDELPSDAQGALIAAQAGDEAGFAALYRATQPRLLRYAASLVGQDAEDVTAEAWLQIARDLTRFAGDEQAFRGWAATIVRNRAMDHVRARARRPSVPIDAEVFNLPGSADTAASAAETFSTAAALELIASLPADQAEAVLLRTVVGLDAATAAAVLGKRPGAVRVAAHRGLRSLARRLETDRDAANAAEKKPAEPDPEGPGVTT